jgi:hypothetical protein
MTRFVAPSLAAWLVASLLAAPAHAQSSAPATPGASPAPAASPAASAMTPVPIRIGTRAVMIMREPFGAVTIKERAAVVQSRIDQVLMHHPYLQASDVKVVREGGQPVIYWGPFPIVAADEAHARANNFSSADLLAHAWATNLREAVREFISSKKLPGRALYRNEKDSDFVYRRTDRTLAKPTDLKNTRYVFNPEDFEWGAGVKGSAQQGFVVFIRKDAANPPQQIYLGNSAGTFTEYEWISPEDETP